MIPGIPRSFESSGSDHEGPGGLALTDIVVRVWPRTSRSITDLLLPKISPGAKPGILQRRDPPKAAPRREVARRAHPGQGSLLSIG